MKDFFRIKPLEQLQGSESPQGKGLRRTLGTFDLTLFGVGAIVGAGIFSAIGSAAAGSPVDGRAGAGPAILVSIVLVALVCAFTAFAYAELGAMIPVSGSAYTYAYATLGEGFAWIIGWDLLLEYAVSNMAVAISWGEYARGFLASALHIHIPGWLAMDPRTALRLAEGAPPLSLGDKLHALERARAGLLDGGALFAHWDVLRAAPMVGGWPLTINLLAVLATLAVAGLAWWGIRESSRGNAVLVLIKMAVLLFVAAAGVWFIDPANYHPFAPHGFHGIHAGAAIMFFAFVGYDAITTLSEECRNPARDLPRGILYSLLICMVLYALVAAVVTGMVPSAKLEGIGDPLAHVFNQHHRQGLATAISAGALVATTTALLTYMVAQPRIMLSMARDGLLGPWFARISPWRRTPSHATWATGIMIALPVALLSLDEVVELTSIGTLFAFAIVSVGLLVLRVRRPEARRPFRMPAAWVTAPLSLLACGWLSAGLPRLTWIRFVLWLGVGLGLYAVYGRRRSRVGGNP